MYMCVGNPLSREKTTIVQIQQGSCCVMCMRNVAQEMCVCTTYSKCMFYSNCHGGCTHILCTVFPTAVACRRNKTSKLAPTSEKTYPVAPLDYTDKTHPTKCQKMTLTYRDTNEILIESERLCEKHKQGRGDVYDL